MKKKVEGVTLIVVLIVGLFLVGLELNLLISIDGMIAFQKKLEVDNQTFLAHQTAKEAAIFHHNSIGKGIKTPGTVKEEDKEEKIKFKIIARGTEEVIEWEQGKTLEIPFFYNDKKLLDENGLETSVNISELTLDFTKANPEIIETAQNTKLDKPMFSWTMVAENKTATSIFAPTTNAGYGNANKEICGGISGFYCMRKDFIDGVGFYGNQRYNFTIQSDSRIPGVVKTLGENGVVRKNFENFIDENTSTLDPKKFTFRITPLIDLKERTLHTKITNGTDEFPLNFYTIETSYETEFRNSSVSSVIEETTNVGSLENIILD